MKYDVGRLQTGKSFFINGVSYIGLPRSNTAMYISKKVEHLLTALEAVDECLIFAEDGIKIPDALKKHAFVFSSRPQLEYARFVTAFAEERLREEKALKYNLTDSGFYLCEDSSIGKNAYIEPGCIIGPDVTIGDNAKLLSGCIVRRATVGDNFLANEHAVIGANGFTMAEDEAGNETRIPTLGRVIIGNQVEIGAQNNVSCGSGGDTVIEDNVKLDSLIHIGHDVHIHKNVRITAGVTVSGYVDIAEHAYIGVGSVIRNRIALGEHSFIGMGSNVTKSVEKDTVVVGNPAKPFVRKQGA